MAEEKEEREQKQSDAEFNAYAADYDASLAAGLKLTGADKAHYARERISWLRESAAMAGVTKIDRVLDFGFGDGDAAPLLRDILGAREVVGVEVSTAMLARARARHPWARFELMDSLPSLGAFDVAYCNGVFHHIPVAERASAVRRVRDALRVGGVFGLWENHPWNPGTRFVMSRVSFDRDAIMLSPPETRRLLNANGLRTMRTDHRFIFPGGLSILRPVEKLLSRLPIGGQYQVLARRDS
jgi:SAM-dependent methyltransferase